LRLAAYLEEATIDAVTAEGAYSDDDLETLAAHLRERVDGLKTGQRCAPRRLRSRSPSRRPRQGRLATRWAMLRTPIQPERSAPCGVGNDARGAGAARPRAAPSAPVASRHRSCPRHRVDGPTAPSLPVPRSRPSTGRLPLGTGHSPCTATELECNEQSRRNGEEHPHHRDSGSGSSIVTGIMAVRLLRLLNPRHPSSPATPVCTNWRSEAISSNSHGFPSLSVRQDAASQIILDLARRDQQAREGDSRVNGNQGLALSRLA
jgi:hypothetical protein